MILQGGATVSTGVEPVSGLFALDLEALGRVQVVTASRKEESIDQAPNVMYVITAEQIQRRGLRSLREVLETTPGFGVFHRDLQFVAQVRGIAANDNEKVAFMIDGHPIGQVWEPETLGGAIPLENLDRIEIIVGPGAVLYGADALTAIVNLIPKQGKLAEVHAAAGTDGTRSLLGLVGEQWDERRGFTISASWRERDGFDAWLPNSSNVRNRNLAGTDVTGRLYPSISILGTGRYDDWSVNFFHLNTEMPDLHLHGNLVADDGRRTDYLHSVLVRKESALTESVTALIKLIRNRFSRGTGTRPLEPV